MSVSSLRIASAGSLRPEARRAHPTLNGEEPLKRRAYRLGWMLLGRETGSLPRSVDEGLEAIEGGLGLEDEPEVVLLLVDTTPKGAKVYVDDLLTSARPIRVPRSEEYLRVRVEAEGYEPRTIQVQPVATRRLEVVLDRARRRRR